MFREIVDTTGGGLAQFIAEYEKLQQALRKSHESETRYAARACWALGYRSPIRAHT
jgi:hypothetical protein